MHTNSWQQTLISPESKEHQSHLTGAPGPESAILTKLVILIDTCGCELMTLHLLSESFPSSLGICIQNVCFQWKRTRTVVLVIMVAIILTHLNSKKKSSQCYTSHDELVRIYITVSGRTVNEQNTCLLFELCNTTTI